MFMDKKKINRWEPTKLQIDNIILPILNHDMSYIVVGHIICSSCSYRRTGNESIAARMAHECSIFGNDAGNGTFFTYIGLLICI